MRRLLTDFLRFGLVGVAATAVHAVVYAAIAHWGLTSPARANLAAFAVAFLVSFRGHLVWTFSERMRGADRRRKIRAFVAFLGVALVGLGCNALAVHICVDRLGLDPLWAVAPMVLVTPLVTFGLARGLAFR